jgi:1-acyl-sn-glycerol-3-phosphate acyltransferase
MLARICAAAITGGARLLTGVRAEWRGVRPDKGPRVYFANHSSHGDFVLVWSVLPPAVRRTTCPVAAADYWNRGRARRFIADAVFSAVLIHRERVARKEDPLTAMIEALDRGRSLILFPEGTRNTTDEPLLPLKSGLYHLARRRPDAQLVPVWIENISRVMPKGELLPIPLLCSVTFGPPLSRSDGEGKESFLARAAAALLELRPGGRESS